MRMWCRLAIVFAYFSVANKLSNSVSNTDFNTLKLALTYFSVNFFGSDSSEIMDESKMIAEGKTFLLGHAIIKLCTIFHIMMLVDPGWTINFN